MGAKAMMPSVVMMLIIRIISKMHDAAHQPLLYAAGRLPTPRGGGRCSLARVRAAAAHGGPGSAAVHGRAAARAAARRVGRTWAGGRRAW
eukprot:scaffold6305_cov304-Prasinococcus_capsulatus_cf.AAC.1